MIPHRKFKLHFVGIGGIGMSGIAEVFLAQGHQVSGSDLLSNETTERLVRMGAVYYSGHASEHVHDVDVVVISSAVKPHNPEVLEAKKQGIAALAGTRLGVERGAVFPHAAERLPSPLSGASFPPPLQKARKSMCNPGRKEALCSLLEWIDGCSCLAC